MPKQYPFTKVRLKLILLFLLLSFTPLILSFIIYQYLGSAYFLILTGSLAFVLLLLSLSLAKFFTTPLEKLISDITAIDKGDLNHRIVLKTGDEFETFANLLNLLVSRLQQTLHHLDQANQIITAERDKVSAALSSIVDPVIAVDLHRKIILFNRAAERLTGLTKEQTINYPIDQVIRLFDKDKELGADTYCPIRTDGFEGTTFSMGNLKLASSKSLSEIYVNLTAAQIREGVNVNFGCILTFHDISHEKQLQEMQLDFVSMAAHELRTPLTAIRGYLSVFLEENSSELNEEQKMFLSRINNSANHLTVLIENLLNVSRIERGALSINPEPLDWTALVRQSIQDLQVRAKEKNIDLQFIDPQQPVSQIKADKLRMNEVLTNLIANALNYTLPGGKVKVWVEQKEGNVITHVEDTGPGIAPEIQHHLFTKFFRVGGKLIQGTKGTGLGLYISKAIVQMHHGQIWVESELGKGSTFSFSIPVFDSAAVSFNTKLD